MSKDKSKLSGDSDKDNLSQNSGGAVYGLIPIAGASAFFPGAVVGTVATSAIGHAVVLERSTGAGKSKIVGEVISESGENSEKEIQIIRVENSELENEPEFSEELDEILTRLHETDSRIVETRQNTVRLGVETRSMLDDLRKQLG